MDFPSVIPVQTISKWLPEIFLEGIAHRNYVVREMAAKTIFVMLYTGAVEGLDRWFRPSQATLMTDAQSRSISTTARLKWASDSLAGRLKHSGKSWYAPNSREPIRDETLRSGLVPLGAVIERPGIATTAASPRYALSRDFCELLGGLHHGASSQTISKWQQDHLTSEAMARVSLLKSGAAMSQTGGRIPIRFPNGETRLMIGGPSATITKAVIELFAAQFLPNQRSCSSAIRAKRLSLGTTSWRNNSACELKPIATCRMSSSSMWRKAGNE